MCIIFGNENSLAMQKQARRGTKSQCKNLKSAFLVYIINKVGIPTYVRMFANILNLYEHMKSYK